MEERRCSLIDHILKLLDGLSVSGAPLDLLEEETGREAHVWPDGQSFRMAREIMDFMDEMPGGFLIYRAGGREEILYANRGLLRIFLCETMEELRALTENSFRGLVHPEDLEAVEESIWQQVAASQHELDHVEYRIVRKDGVARWVEDYGHFVRTESLGGVFYVFLADATEKREKLLSERSRLLREKEEENRRELQALMEEYSRERSRLDREYQLRMKVIEGLGVNYDSIFYVDLDKDIILPYRQSSRSADVFAGDRQTWMYSERMNAYLDRWVCSEDREMVARAVSAEELRRQLSTLARCYVNYRAADGDKLLYLQFRFVAIGPQERVSQLILGCRRVDEELQREMEQKLVLEEALENAKLSIVAKNTFLSNMSHDMRTPLNAIFGFTTMARQSLPDTEAVRGYLDRIEDSSHQLLELIDKVLRLSWTDANEAPAGEEECSLEGVLKEVRQFLLPQAEEKEIDFTLDCSGVSHDRIKGDRKKLSQLVMYLANNAVTYTPHGGSVVITAVEAETASRSCADYRIAVRDTGIGISEDFLKQIFEPFARERNTTLSGIYGVGLGLTIAKNITDLLGGTIEIESTVDKGSVFTVTLRLHFQDKVPQPDDTPPAEGPADAPSGRRLLVVEDNEINLEIETEILESLDFTVDTARDGKIAVEKVRASAAGDYDLILMDIQMPVMDGWEATRAIRALPDPDQAGIPIVALSANVFDSDVRKSMDAGMDAHLAKPIDVPLLLETIERIMERREQP